jgi:prepilin-type N-terminal cleavage/methylation domain-containing protein
LHAIIKSAWRRNNKVRRAFTLIEVVITIVILGIVSTLFLDSLFYATSTLFLFENRKQSVFMVNFGLRRMLKDCRYIQRGGISRAELGRIDYEDAYGRMMSFRQNGADLEMSMDNGANYFVLAEGIAVMTIHYFDKLNAPLTVPVANRGDIHWMEITLEGSPEILNYKNSAQVFPREMFR